MSALFQNLVILTNKYEKCCWSNTFHFIPHDLLLRENKYAKLEVYFPFNMLNYYYKLISIKQINVNIFFCIIILYSIIIWFSQSTNVWKIYYIDFCTTRILHLLFNIPMIVQLTHPFPYHVTFQIVCFAEKFYNQLYCTGLFIHTRSDNYYH